MTPDEATKAMKAMTAIEAAIKPRLDTLMRQYDPAKYDKIKAQMFEDYPTEQVTLRLIYDINLDKLRYVYASTMFYAHEGRDTLASSIAWERYDKHGNLIDHFETPKFREALRRKLKQESHWNPAAEAVLPLWQAVDYAAPQQAASNPAYMGAPAWMTGRVEAAAQQAQLGCIPKGTKGTVTEAGFKTGSLADFYFAKHPLTEAQMRAAGINVQQEPAPTPGITDGELWWQQERREAAVKQDALVVMRADVRRMLMGG